MILRDHATASVRSSALHSACGHYRFRLDRAWAPGAGVLWVMLNPSTATEVRNDPTVERCERRSRAMGFPGYTVCNLFAWRSTDPAGLARTDDPVAPGNDAVILEAAAGAGLILCAWGAHGTRGGRGAEVARMLVAAGHRLHVLGLTGGGQPRHPLYVPYAAGAVPWLPQAS